MWAAIERWGINVHPSYKLGLGRTSCCACIFGSANQFSTLRHVAPERFEKVARYEDEFEGTIKRSGLSVRDLADRGRPYPGAVGSGGGLSRAAKQATTAGFDAPVLLSPRQWELPAGAFGETGCGPR